jgi:hypothetical protein
MTQLDPQAQSLLEAMKASGQRPLFTMPVPDARRARRRLLVADPPRVEIAKVEDDLVRGAAVEHLHLEDQMHGFLLQETTVDRARETAGHFADTPRPGLARGSGAGQPPPSGGH